jgi:hypothetical protein
MPCLLILLVTGLSMAVPGTPPDLEVELDSSSMTITGEVGQLKLAVRNHTGRPIPVDVTFACRHTSDSSELASDSNRLVLAPGLSMLSTDFDRAAIFDEEPWSSELQIWYELAPERGEPVTGLLPLVSLLPDAFMLNPVLTSLTSVTGDRELVVRALHPTRGSPSAGVEVELLVDDEPADRATTAKDGAAILKLPDLSWPGAYGTTLTIDGHRGRWQHTVEAFLEEDWEGYLSLASDLPVYKPGSTMHFRLLALAPDRRALAGEQVSVKLERGPWRSRKVLRSAELVTDEHGMAHGSWKLEGIAEESYDLIAETADGLAAEREIVIESFQTPTILVGAEQERPYYLPGELLRLEMTTTTASGLPLPDAPVRLLDIEGWLQTDGSSELLWQGTTGSDGSCWAEIRVPERRRWSYMPAVLSGELLLAEATDPVTGATAYGPVSLRLARHPLIVKAGVPASATPGLPAELHILTSSPTGEPVVAAVEVYRRHSAPLPHQQVIAPETWPEGPLLARVETDEHGVATLRQPLVPPQEDDWSQLVLEVTTDDGLYRSVEIDLLPKSSLQLYPLRVLLAVGEPIELEVLGFCEQVFIDAFAGARHVGATAVRLTGGRAHAEIPYHPLMQGEVSLYASTSVGPVDLHPSRSAAVVYPAEDQDRLQIGIEVAPVVASPGAEVKALIHCQERPAHTTLLGVAVVDAAVDSYRSDVGYWQEYVDRPWFLGSSKCGLDHLSACEDYWEYWDDSWLHFGQVSGISRSDLPRLAGSDSTREAYDTVARLLLAGSPDADLIPAAWWELEESSDQEWWSKLEWQAPKPGLDKHREALDAAFAAGAAAVIRRDAAAYTAELAHHGVDLEALRDPWSNRYRVGFAVDGRVVTARLISAGPDLGFAEEQTDDLIVWEEALDAFAPLEARIKAALEKFISGDVGASETLLQAGTAELVDLLHQSGLADEELVDLHGNPIDIEVVDLPGVGREIRIWGRGADGVRGTRDDRGLASLIPQGAGEQLTIDVIPGVRYVPEVSATTGALAGIVSAYGQVDDYYGWPPSVSLKMYYDAAGKYQDEAGLRFHTTADQVGFFYFDKLPPGEYRLDVYCGRGEIDDWLIIKAGSVSYRHMVLSRRMRQGFAEEITVASGAQQKAQPPRSLSRRSQAQELLRAVRSRGSNGRLRQHFVDTLLWRPDIVVEGTDTVPLSFNLADNLTTWKMQVVASTADGRWHTAAADIHSVQPLVAELDLPPLLTDGDLIELPVTVRNYSAEHQEVVTSISPAGVLERHGEVSRQQLRVAPLAAGQVTFPVQAVSHGAASVEAAALANQLSDRLRLATEVRPDGRQVVRSAARHLRGDAVFETEIPATQLPGTSSGMIRFYPDLLAQLSESAAGLVARPTGCAEQITSRARINLAVLELLSQSQHDSIQKTAGNARKYLAQAVNMLEQDLTPSGGYAYWSATDKPYIDLTAYVTGFLMELDQEGSVAVPRHMIDRPLSWLAAHQQEGAWEDLQKTVLVLRVLADALTAGSDKAAPEVVQVVAAARRRLAQEVGESRDPYMVASYLTVVAQTGRQAEVAAALARLQELAECDEKGCRWPAKGNIPFWGWGRVATIINTSLALRGLVLAGDSGVQAPAQLIEETYSFLIQSKDPEGLWWSTRGTVAALRALSSTLAGREGAEQQPVTIEVNGTPVEYQQSEDRIGPVEVDISPLLQSGVNRVVMAGGSNASAMLVTRWYESWPAQGAAVGDAFGIDIDIDPEQLQVGEPVELTVSITGRQKQWGMVVAEIGLPPGAEVDRQSHQGNGQLEVASNHARLYLWLGRGEQEQHRFSFRPRLAGSMATAPHRVYSYYTPEELTELAPLDLVIRQRPR